MLDLTLGAALSELFTVFKQILPALIGSGIYVLIGSSSPTWTWRTLANFVISAIVGYAAGQIAGENYASLAKDSWTKDGVIAIVSVFSVEIITRSYGKIDAVLERLVNMVPSWQEIRELFRGKP